MTTYNEYDFLRREERKRKAKQAEQPLDDVERETSDPGRSIHHRRIKKHDH